MEWLGHFDVFNHTLAQVLAESPCVEPQPETERSAFKYLDVLEVVELGNTLNLRELDIVPIFELLSLVIVHVDQWVLPLLYITHNALTGRFTVPVCDQMLVAII